MLTDIERTKSSLDGDFWHRYDLFNIALAVIDQVALAMGISAGRTWDETVDYAGGQAARQVPDAAPTQWRAVAERVVVSLVTTDVETVPYLVHSDEGPKWLAQRFRLLYAHASPDGGEHLRASEQAINIFIDALDLEIEAAQVANEAQLRALIARGAIESAVAIARHARYRSIQLQEKVRRIVADTLIDPDTHDWVDDVPAVLDTALTHVAERLAAETELLDAVADRRGDLTDSVRLASANQLVEILRECRHRHNELHGHLIGARGRLRDALDDRFGRPVGAAHLANIGSDLLDPYLLRPTGQAAAVAPRLLAAVGGIAARWWPSLATLVDELCAPPRQPGQGEEVEEPEFADSTERAWWEPYEDTVAAMLDALEEPIRLSQLLARVEETAAGAQDDDGEPLDPSALAAAVVHAAHRAWTTRLAGRTSGERVVVGVDTGAALDTGQVRSADLLLVPATVTADIDAAAPTRPAARDVPWQRDDASHEPGDLEPELAG
ncbi:hypothetical protein [Frankia nepalensis]|uniref:Uncharacterized protein n=1 Tax=Frankia nepalensis TaxID=1836974 RepID=A0A937RF68_9ACTN|nr:hypothetical protein [Frankia nepalensis]MBL7500560.1 hypothetical protein [Frankia nepalensis]MBL7509746.1 hypothetical protein [Frankia nepalensis]MBL7627865.1 hypothetical protein [Frankia nepalensis]